MSDELAALKRKVAELEAKQSAKKVVRQKSGLSFGRFLFIVAGIIVATAYFGTSSDKPQLVSKPQPVSNPHQGKAHAEILAYARSVADKWAKELKSGQGQWPITAEEVRKLRVALDGIQSPSAEKMAAIAMLGELSRLHHQQDKLDEAAEEKRIADDASGRAEYASTMQNLLLKQFMDATVRVGGTKNTTLTIEYVLINRPLVYNLINDEGVAGAIGARGFKVVVLTDGYDSTWRFAVSKTGWKPM